MVDDELDEAEEVLVWRAGRLITIGVGVDRAILLADSPIDVHEFEALVERGCSTELAERILEP